MTTAIILGILFIVIVGFLIFGYLITLLFAKIAHGSKFSAKSPESHLRDAKQMEARNRKVEETMKHIDKLHDLELEDFDESLGKDK